jgi:hypothetical protein
MTESKGPRRGSSVELIVLSLLAALIVVLAIPVFESANRPETKMPLKKAHAEQARY